MSVDPAMFRQFDPRATDADRFSAQASCVAGLSVGASGNSAEASSGPSSISDASYDASKKWTGADRVEAAARRQLDVSSNASTNCVII